MATVADTVPSTARERQLAGLRPRWQKGQSGNPAGRPAGLAKRIREATADGEDLVTFMVGVLKNGREKTADRITAATWLADRCWGRPAQTVELRADEDSERHARLAALSPQERAELRVELLRRLDGDRRNSSVSIIEVPQLLSFGPAV